MAGKRYGPTRSSRCCARRKENGQVKKTLADYVTIAISPVLIMALVGSLVFFLQEAFYQGNYDGRVGFILAMFVIC